VSRMPAEVHQDWRLSRRHQFRGAGRTGQVSGVQAKEARVVPSIPITYQTRPSMKPVDPTELNMPPVCGE